MTDTLRRPDVDRGRAEVTLTAIQFRMGAISRQFGPRGYGWCLKCRTTWVFVQGHMTQYNERNGCFPLCRLCWSEMKPQQRLPYYAEMMAEWVEQSRTNAERLEALRQWPEMERAVLAGL